MITLTNPPSIPKDRSTRVGLRIISQEPLRIEFHWVSMNSRVVHDSPVQVVKSGGKRVRRLSLRTLPHSPNVRDYQGSLRDEISLVSVVLGRDVWYSWWVPLQSVPGTRVPYYDITGILTQWSDWIPPVYLFHYCVNVGKVRLISKRRESITPDDPIDLCLSFPLNLRMHHHSQIKRMNR